MQNLGQLYFEYTGERALEQVPMSASGSNRRYYRLTSAGQSLIGVQGTSREENEAFLYMAQHFREKGLNVPRVVAVSDDKMLYLQEDLGDTLLFDFIADGRKTGVFHEDEKAMLLARAVQMFMPGKPQVWYLDLFAGTGQLGIEALSRGARECVFVDNSRASLALVRKNLEICQMTAQVVQSDALSFLSRSGKFDLVFVDPPYHEKLYGDVLHALFMFDILHDGGIIIVESMRGESMPEAPAPYIRGKTYSYGKISLTIYTRT